MTRTVDLDTLTAEDFRHLATLKDGEPARLQSACDECLRRHLLRLTALMPPADRQAVLALLRSVNPSIVLDQHFRAFLSAHATRAQLPQGEKGWLYRPSDVAPCDEDTAVAQALGAGQFARELARLEQEIPDLEQLIAASYDAAAVSGLTPAEAKPLIIAGLRARRTRRLGEPCR